MVAGAPAQKHTLTQDRVPGGNTLLCNPWQGNWAAYPSTFIIVHRNTETQKHCTLTQKHSGWGEVLRLET